jgi:thiamine-monophosphate kinase
VTIGSLGGEFALIDRIAAATPGGDGLRTGIGDDAAVLRTSAGNDLVVTTDLLIEDVHFRLSWSDPFSLGVKAAAVNLSDIAAMGARPTAAFLSIALRRDTKLEFVDELYRGLNDTFGRWGAVIAGGDTNVSPGPFTLNVTLVGGVGAGGAILRSTARPGDIIIVTGALGGAAAGLMALEKFGRDRAESDFPDAVAAQLRPVPRLTESAAITGVWGATAMMDVSDGLVADLAKLCRAGGVGARVDRDATPVHPAAVAVAAAIGINPTDLALNGGEDYELLVTAAPERAEALLAALQRTGTPATVIGVITTEPGVRLETANGESVTTGPGWDHFAYE